VTESTPARLGREDVGLRYAEHLASADSLARTQDARHTDPQPGCLLPILLAGKLPDQLVSGGQGRHLIELSHVPLGAAHRNRKVLLLVASAEIPASSPTMAACSVS